MHTEFPLHVLKTDPEVFQALVRGIKDYEIRYNDRNFQVGDILELQETVYSGHQVTFEGKPVEYTGQTALKKVTHILSGYGLKDGWVILNVKPFMDTVALPQDVDQAKMMALLGMEWLARHTPDQIRYPLTRDQIRQVFLENGFTVKAGETDLKEYVFKAAEELMAFTRYITMTKQPISNDDAAVDVFANAMKAKLADASAKGRKGWQNCHRQELSNMLREHVEKGDPRDVANFCMFLYHLGWGIEKAQGLSPAQEPKYTTNGSAIVNRASGEAIPEDEPVFVFRARDALSVRALTAYLEMIGEREPASTHSEAVTIRINDFKQFSMDHPERMKWPDTWIVK